MLFDSIDLLALFGVYAGIICEKSLEVSNLKRKHPENGHMEPKNLVPLVDVFPFPSAYFQVPAVSFPGCSVDELSTLGTWKTWTCCMFPLDASEIPPFTLLGWLVNHRWEVFSCDYSTSYDKIRQVRS